MPYIDKNISLNNKFEEVDENNEKYKKIYNDLKLHWINQLLRSESSVAIHCISMLIDFHCYGFEVRESDSKPIEALMEINGWSYHDIKTILKSKR